MNFLSSNIKYLRIQNKTTPEELADITEKSPLLISAWETNKCEPRLNDIIKISNYFNILIDDLITKDLKVENIDELKKAFQKSKNVNQG